MKPPTRSQARTCSTLKYFLKKMRRNLSPSDKTKRCRLKNQSHGLTNSSLPKECSTTKSTLITGRVKLNSRLKKDSGQGMTVRWRRTKKRWSSQRKRRLKRLKSRRRILSLGPLSSPLSLMRVRSSHMMKRKTNQLTRTNRSKEEVGPTLRQEQLGKKIINWLSWIRESHPFQSKLRVLLLEWM